MLAQSLSFYFFFKDGGGEVAKCMLNEVGLVMMKVVSILTLMDEK